MLAILLLPSSSAMRLADRRCGYPRVARRVTIEVLTTSTPPGATSASYLSSDRWFITTTAGWRTDRRQPPHPAA
jgi:hypothetical protein